MESGRLLEGEQCADSREDVQVAIDRMEDTTSYSSHKEIEMYAEGQLYQQAGRMVVHENLHAGDSGSMKDNDVVLESEEAKKQYTPGIFCELEASFFVIWC